MSDTRLSSLGLEVPMILLPQAAVVQKWPVIACDQFTQDREYWEKVKTFTGNAPSALNLIFPEIFLSDDAPRRISDIHSTMKRYLREGVFREPRRGFVYTERDTPFNKKRRGLIAAIDLERYEWKDNARPLIRCTEGTVPERLPARMNVRRDAPLEVPHVLLLIDDDTDSLLPGLAEMVKKDPPIYDTPLMMDSGNVKGWFLDDSASFYITEKLDELYRRSVSRYTGEAGQPAALQTPFLFAVGDGNHSLAAAKGVWEEYKAVNGGRSHPCRYALVEIENIYDPAIQFEPIHRIVFGMGFDKAISLLSRLPGFNCRPVKNTEELSRLCARLPAADATPAANCFGLVSEGRYALIKTTAAGISTATSGSAAAFSCAVCLQPLLDGAVENDRSLSIDYIHDEEELFRLTAQNAAAAGILLPPVQKAGLFETVARLGPLPRKSFSMGHACEKRFYLECRELFV